MANIVASLRNEHRFDNMLTRMNTTFSRNPEVRAALTSVNQLEQPIVINAIAAQIPAIVHASMPEIEAFRTRQKEMTKARLQKKNNKKK